MAKRAKRSEPSEPQPEAGIVKADEPFPPEDAPPEPEAGSKLQALPEPTDVATEELDNGRRAVSSDRPYRAPAAAPPALPPGPPPEPTYHAPSGPSFGQRVGSFFGFLFRLLLLLISLALISVALYYVIPWFYQSFVRPVEQNAAQVRELQTWQQQTVQDLSDLQTKLQTIESVQNEHDRSLTEMDQRLNDIETEITARTQSLAAIEQMQTELQTQAESDSAELQRQIGLLKSMELLSRARLFLYQSNFGLAEQDVQLARELLLSLRRSAERPLAQELDAVIQRLDLTISSLPEFPVAASDDLDIAWQILLSGLPVATPTAAQSPTPTLVGTVSATLAASDVTITPTFVGTLEPTPTP